MKNIGYGKEYKYSHAYEGNFEEQEYFPDKLIGTKLYDPGNNQSEQKLRERLKALWKDKYRY
jgi:putative ATPase